MIRAFFGEALGKQCPKCGLWKTRKDFSINNVRKDGMSCYCKTCQKLWRESSGYAKIANARSKKHYRDNREKQIKLAAKYRAEHQERAAELRQQHFQAWLNFLGPERMVCQVCGFNKSFVALDFHHRNPNDKKVEISRLLKLAYNTKNKKIMEIELEKCDILCSNCHKMLHEQLQKEPTQC